MTPLRAGFQFRRLVLLLCLPGCFTWKPIALASTPELGRWATIRVERADKKRDVVWRARVVGDSLRGRREGSRIRMAVALADVQRAEQRRFSVARTMSLVLVGAALAGVVAAGLASSSGYGLGCPSGQRAC